MNKVLAWFVIVSAAWIPIVAAADSVYSYAGNDYTSFNMDYGYSTSNQITLSLVFSNPLAADGCFASVAGVAGCTYDPLISFSMSDGHYIISGAPNAAEFAVLSTRNGVITSWEAGYVTLFEELQTINPNGTTIPGLPLDFSQTSVSCGQNCVSALQLGSSATPGIWTTPTPVPLPGSLWLMLSVIGAWVMLFGRPVRGARRLGC